VFLLAIDSCDSRGSIALLREEKILSEVAHPAAEDYSSWLLPAVQDLLLKNAVSHGDLAGYAVAAGPGSFTGVRVGLTTTKAWSEVYGKPVFPVSRLQVLADAAPANADFAATFIDAQRNQVFAALYRKSAQGWQNVIQESVISPLDYFGMCLSAAGDSRLAWISLDHRILTDSPLWHSLNLDARAVGAIVELRPPLAASVGRFALRHLESLGVDALALDANYVRRSDAEIFGKKVAST
jgi:tRNA threonylcarbamoyladenosine biosynthesis protein TsaB